jgi:hypothetical protein
MIHDDSRPDERIWLADPPWRGSSTGHWTNPDEPELDQRSGRVLAGAIVIAVLLLTLALVVTWRGGLS